VVPLSAPPDRDPRLTRPHLPILSLPRRCRAGVRAARRAAEAAAERADTASVRVLLQAAHLPAAAQERLVTLHPPPHTHT
jgi:hypothetical protein